MIINRFHSFKSQVTANIINRIEYQKYSFLNLSVESNFFNKLKVTLLYHNYESILFISMLFLTYLMISMIVNGAALYTVIYSKSQNVTFKYVEGVLGENDLHECKFHEACNIVHDRFWMSSLTERLCQCPNGKECPWQWADKSNESEIFLNNRSVLKFCVSILEIDRCTTKQTAAIIHGKSDSNNTYLIPQNVTVNCLCPETHYWKLQKYTYEGDNIVQEFKCAKKRMCENLDFCGYIRSDLYSTYYKCTCPQNHLCIYDKRIEENVQELLYSGPAYKAYCYPL